MDSSPLGRLPAELRNRIYELALECPTALKILSDGARFKWHQTHQATARTHPTALVKICRVIRQQSTQVLYAAYNFEISICNRVSLPVTFHNFCELVGTDNSNALRNVTFVYARPITHSSFSSYAGPNRLPSFSSYGDSGTPDSIWLSQNLVGLRRVIRYRPKCTLNVQLLLSPLLPGQKSFKMSVTDLGKPWDEMNDYLEQRAHDWQGTVWGPWQILLAEVLEAQTRVWRNELKRVELRDGAELIRSFQPPTSREVHGTDGRHNRFEGSTDANGAWQADSPQVSRIDHIIMADLDSEVN